MITVTTFCACIDDTYHQQVKYKINKSFMLFSLVHIVFQPSKLTMDGKDNTTATVSCAWLSICLLGCR